MAQSLGGLPYNLQAQQQMMQSSYAGKNAGYLGSKMQNPKVKTNTALSSHEIMGSQFG